MRSIWTVPSFLLYNLMQLWTFIVVDGHGGIISDTGQVYISREEQAQVLTLKRLECYRLMLNQTRSKGTFCNRTFDDILCWPDALPGETSYLPCPDYIQSFYITGNASRTCLPDGTWLTSPITNLSWTNYSECIHPRTTKQHTEVPQFMTTHVEYIQVMCSTGYAVSFVSLSLAVVIMVRFKKLHCPRNIVHINLFSSFILKAVLSFSKDIFWVQGVGFSFDVEQKDSKIIFLPNRTHWECKLFTSVSNYAQTANYFWILIEGLYLHTLVYVSVFSERSSVRWYYLLGWGAPFLSVLPWVAVRIAYEDILCWNTNTNLQFVWILKGPIVLTLVINFAFFVNILRALFTKLHKSGSKSARRNRYRRLAKATLILIPLFGVHYIVFLGVPYRVDPTAEIVKLYFEIFFNSFQGFFVAVLFCFLNQEGTLVVGGIKRTWEVAYNNGRINLFNFDPDPTVRHTFWNLFFGSIIRGFGLTFNQSTVQRISSIPTLVDAKRVLLLMAPGHFLALSLAVIEGIIAYAYFDTIRCDPIESGQVSNPNQVDPTMVMDMFHNIPGMAGIFLATVFSVSLSTLDSGLSSMPAQFWIDIVKPYRKNVSEDRAILISKISVFVFGGFAVIIAFMIDLIGGTLIQITGSMLSAFSGPLTGLFLFGAFCPWGNSKGAFWGTLISAACSFKLSLGQMTTNGAKRNYNLPPAPIDQCGIDGLMDLDIANVTESLTTLANVTLGTLYTTTTMNDVTQITPEATGFSRIFMVSYQWFGAIGVLQTMLYGSIISFCTGHKRPGEVDKKYLIPFVDSLCRFLPECIRRPLRCGYGHDAKQFVEIEEVIDDTKF